jgi:TM2 domain-containing membrane protein YozV
MEYSNYLTIFPGATSEEIAFIKQSAETLTDDQVHTFINLYRERRKDPQNVMLFSLLGLISIAGVQRFYLNQIGMGLLYFFTAGFCLIGTVIDLINYTNLAVEANKKIAIECMQLARI